MKAEFDNVIQQAQQAEEISNHVKDWMKFNVSEEEFPSEAKKLDRIAREVRSVQRAAGQRPSIFLFGASQVGKSYLVHNIAKHPDSGRCEICVGQNETVDFIDTINPPGGGKESTGISTRFRVGAPPADVQYPFKAKLFNAVDVAAVAVNSYFNDLASGTDVSEADVQSWMQQAKAQAFDKAEVGVGVDALAYFIEYCEARYSQQSTIATLKRLGYFEVVGECLPFLPVDLRLKGLSFLWGGLPFWSRFVDRMWKALQSLGYPAQVLLPRDSVVSSDSLVNVKLMDELLSGGGKEVILKSGQSIQRSELAFLIRELELVIPEAVANGMGECLRHADLVDFPGARSRLPLDVAVLQSSSESDHKNQTLCIRRGKVAYLFDLYNQELEIGSLLLCMDDGQPEVQTIPRLIQDWIHRNIGDQPDARQAFSRVLKETLSKQGVAAAGHVNPLFAVLTKFNRSMVPNEGNSTFDVSSETERVQGRFRSNFTDWLQKDPADKWLNNWDGEPFKNVYPVRDPAHSKGLFAGYEEHGHETGYVFGADEKLRQMGEVFAGAEAVQARIENPRAVWSEIAQPNCTGIESLLAHVAPAAHPALKLAQVKTLLTKSIQELYHVAAQRHVAGDLDQELAKAKAMGANTRLLLAGLGMRSERKKIVSLMSAMGCANELGMRAYNQTYLESQAPVASSEVSETGTTWTAFADSLGIVLDGVQSPLNQIAGEMGMDEESLKGYMRQHQIIISEPKKVHKEATPSRHILFGKRLMSAWISSISEWLNEDHARGKGWTPEEHDFVKSYVHSLIEGRIRSGLQLAVSEAVIGDFKQPQPSESMAWHAATVSSRIINQYVNSFGLEVTTTEVPANQDEVRKRSGASGYWNAWTRNLQRSFEENVRHQFDAPDDGKLESNRILGELVEKIKAVDQALSA